MRKIRIIGDIHGDFNAYKSMINGCDESIQVGDYGIGFVPNQVTDLKHRFIRGNHDDPKRCQGEVNHILDGTIEVIDGAKIMYIGGASSIDKAYRTEGVSWWRDEECSYSQFLHFFDIYCREKPDIMITHECPEEVSNVLCNTTGISKFSEKSVTRLALQNMFEHHKPELWCFSHWHVSFAKNILGTKFICLNINEYMDIEVGDESN